MGIHFRLFLSSRAKNQSVLQGIHDKLDLARFQIVLSGNNLKFVTFQLKFFIRFNRISFYEQKASV